MTDDPARSSPGEPAADEDVAMGGTNGDEKKDVKLEDLFADVDSDDEFPAAKPDGIKPSSPPVAPSSPVYGYRSSFACLMDTLRSFADPGV